METLVISAGPRVLALKPGLDQDWREIADFRSLGLKDLSRLAINPRGRPDRHRGLTEVGLPSQLNQTRNQGSALCGRSVVFHFYPGVAWRRGRSRPLRFRLHLRPRSLPRRSRRRRPPSPQALRPCRPLSHPPAGPPCFRRNPNPGRLSRPRRLRLVPPPPNQPRPRGQPRAAPWQPQACWRASCRGSGGSSPRSSASGNPASPRSPDRTIVQFRNAPGDKK